MRAQAARGVEELRRLALDHAIVAGESDGALGFEVQIERLSLAHHRVRLVQAARSSAARVGVEMCGRVFEAQETQRAHRVAGVDRGAMPYVLQSVGRP